MDKKPGGILELSVKVEESKREAFTELYKQSREMFLKKIPGAMNIQLLNRPEDMQIVHAFDSITNAEECLKSDVHSHIMAHFRPYFHADPDIRLYIVVE